jgi:hypothetical protein
VTALARLPIVRDGRPFVVLVYPDRPSMGHEWPLWWALTAREEHEAREMLGGRPQLPERAESPAFPLPSGFQVLALEDGRWACRQIEAG